MTILTCICDIRDIRAGFSSSVSVSVDGFLSPFDVALSICYSGFVSDEQVIRGKLAWFISIIIFVIVLNHRRCARRGTAFVNISFAKKMLAEYRFFCFVEQKFFETRIKRG